jgi:hypothetical protein
MLVEVCTVRTPEFTINDFKNNFHIKPETTNKICVPQHDNWKYISVLRLVSLRVRMSSIMQSPLLVPTSEVVQTLTAVTWCGTLFSCQLQFYILRILLFERHCNYKFHTTIFLIH